VASFRWTANPEMGGCIFCGTSDSHRGFVDCISETFVKGVNGEIKGVVNVIACGNCAEQLSALVGTITAKEAEDLAFENGELVTRNEKLKDEIRSWQQRYEAIASTLLDRVESLHIDKTTVGTGGT
jgi:FtsZ-binding cell division protein ZapB